MTVLITGFEPFGGGARNPSQDVVRAIAQSNSDHSLVTEILPVEFTAAHHRLEQLIRQHQPAAWLGFGLSQRADAITLERIAVNLDDATIADNGGELRTGQMIDPTGEEIYRSTLPLDAIADALRRQNIPAVFSDSAGRFVCNHVFYRAMHILGRSESAGIGGFVHIPWPSDWEQTGKPCHTVTFATILRAGEACFTTILRELRTQNSFAT